MIKMLTFKLKIFRGTSKSFVIRACTRAGVDGGWKVSICSCYNHKPDHVGHSLLCCLLISMQRWNFALVFVTLVKYHTLKTESLACFRAPLTLFFTTETRWPA
jgi:hypothetical protein